jgi:ubiquinone/menaquinone biosynthesis C-methylase UbiE
MDISRFATQGPPWAERAAYGELEAVLSPRPSSPRRNRFLHGVHLYGARRALALVFRQATERPVVVDFGCGTGRFVRFFGRKGCAVVGLDVTPEMIMQARKHGLPEGCELQVTDGITIPREDASVDLVWVCAVLKYTLFVKPSTEFIRQADPTYPRIAREMYRVLKPGGHVVSLEMYVDVTPDVFVTDFDRAGFVTRQVRLLQRDSGRAEEYSQSAWMPMWCVETAGRVCAAYRYWLDAPAHPGGICDYFFVWQKPL